MPWYRQFWPWFLLSFPALSVIAGIATFIIAAHEPDGLVVADYYRAGLAINEDLARHRQAEERGIAGEFTIDHDSGTVELTLSAVYDDQVLLRWVHPTRAAQDITAVLYRDGRGRYTGQIFVPATARKRLLVEPLDGSWRLRGELYSLAQQTVQLTPD